MDISGFLEPFERLLADHAGTPDLWQVVTQSGFLDIMVPEKNGGAGLSLAEAEPLLRALGRYGISAPVTETMAARAVLADAGIQSPDGPIRFKTAQSGTSSAHESGFDLTMSDGNPICQSSMGNGPASTDLRPLGAVIAAVEIAGGAEKLLGMCIDHANTRVQFGKPIAKLQAIQQQLAVLAQHAVMARMSAQIGCAQGLRPTVEHAAIAKQVSSAAVPVITSIAHAVHGAIGVTQDFSLHVFVRRLQALRQMHGSETYWAKILGARRLEEAELPTVDFIRK